MCYICVIIFLLNALHPVLVGAGPRWKATGTATCPWKELKKLATMGFWVVRPPAGCLLGPKGLAVAGLGSRWAAGRGGTTGLGVGLVTTGAGRGVGRVKTGAGRGVGRVTIGAGRKVGLGVGAAGGRTIGFTTDGGNCNPGRPTCGLKLGGC